MLAQPHATDGNDTGFLSRHLNSREIDENYIAFMERKTNPLPDWISCKLSPANRIQGVIIPTIDGTYSDAVLKVIKTVPKVWMQLMVFSE